MTDYGTFGSSVIRPWVATPVAAGIGVWLDGVGQVGTYRTAEQMNGRTRLRRCREGVPISNGTRIAEVLKGSVRSVPHMLFSSWTGSDTDTPSQCVVIHVDAERTRQSGSEQTTCTDWSEWSQPGVRVDRWRSMVRVCGGTFSAPAVTLTSQQTAQNLIWYSRICAEKAR